ncbi:hypothetical protein CN277_11090 [Bacillus cereus]|nr:hypothetical protein COM68_22265 [Bacillus cereus]PFC62506.1 hypothetical protein CN267_08560 [Bacillus cereus]PFD02790.1 hypothetical protein CN277_11090 [Bacillus cereus]
MEWIIEQEVRFQNIITQTNKNRLLFAFSREILYTLSKANRSLLMFRTVILIIILYFYIKEEKQ